MPIEPKAARAAGKRAHLIDSARAHVEANIGPLFHDKLLSGLEKLKLERLLKRKNPYLFRAKGLTVASDLVKALLDAHLSSTEETVFGDFLEGLAIHVCAQAFGGRKSSAEGIDLEFEKAGARYIVSVKSGPNWGNSQQIKRMQANFKQAQMILRGKQKLVAVNGCCYGQDSKPDKGNYFKYCGQEFWQLITDSPGFYVDIVEPLGHQAKLRTEVFSERYSQVINSFAKEFLDKFCELNGQIAWERLIEFNSRRSS